jgi:hypothetical protein
MLLELGYVGRKADKLYQGVDLNSVPFFMKDPRSGQTFAQAFDAVAAALRAGTRPARQPWFDNMLRGSALCDPNCTAGVADAFAAEFTNGAVFDLFSSLNSEFVTGPLLNTDQVFLLYMISDLGRSNYNAGFVTLTKRMSNGLTFGANYTLGRSNDQVGINQNSLNSASNPFDLDYDYGPSIWDRRHTLNAYWYYDLPLWRDNKLGGWYFSGIYTAASGLPLDFYQATCQEWGAGIFGNCASVIPSGSLSLNRGTHRGVSGSGGVGTASAAGLNLFANPEAVFNSFRRISVGDDTNRSRGVIRGQARWNVDISVGKLTRLTESIKLRFGADFANVFNRVEFGDPSLDLTNPSVFGVLNTQYNQPRFIQLGFRVEW